MLAAQAFGGATARAEGARNPAAADLDVAVVGRFVEGDQEILALRPKIPPTGLGNGARIELEQPAGRPAPWSAVVHTEDAQMLFLLRRQIPPLGERQSALVFPRARSRKSKAPVPMRFALPAAANAPADASLKLDWLRSLRDGLAHGAGAWHEFARAKLAEMVQAQEAKGDKAASPGKRPRGAVRVGVEGGRRRPDPTSLRNLMDTTTGLTSLREALQTDRPLRTRFAGEAASLPIAALAGPRLAQHPWQKMLAALGRAAPDEPLARAAPARFYYLRFASLSHLFRVLDEADAWITPGAAMSSGFSVDQALGQRYEAELGLQRSLASRLLGPQVVTDVAVVGSDPYVREGTDLTFIFRAKSAQGFAAGLASSLAGHQKEHGKPSVETVTHRGEAITVTRSEDGVVRQHRAQVGEFHLVSNSPGAIKIVIDTIQGKSPALADALDFRYFLARDAAVPADVLGFLSDAFVAEVVGPRQKILESRRMLAQSDLLVPGYAALLHGWMVGRPPRSANELLASGLLAPEDLRHVAGGAIAFAPGSAARSAWGKVAALTPLVDLPPVTKVTATERDAYRMFAESYQRNFGQYMDPVALRAKLDPAAGRSLRVDLRVLPIIESSEYREMQRTVGDARLEVPGPGGGAMAALGIGPRASLRKLLGEMARDMPSALRAHLDWLGDLAFVGVEDRFDARAYLEIYNREGRGREEDMARIAVEAPLFAGVGVRNALAAGLMLGTIRKMIAEAAPGAVDWREIGKERGVPFVRVSAARGGEAHRLTGDLGLYYAFCKDYLLLSLNGRTLRSRIGDCLDRRLPKSAGPGTAAGAQKPQLVLGLGAKPGGPLQQLAGALVRQALEEAQVGSWHAAEAVARGAPGLDQAALRRLAVAYLGGVPLDENGADLLGNLPRLPPERPRGRRRHPKLAFAAAGSPAAQLVSAFAKARSEIAFDREVTLAGEPEPIQSLHVVLSVGVEK